MEDRTPLRDIKPVREHGSPSVGPLNPNSRLGRKAIPFAQGRDQMNATYVGIDVSKKQLDVHVLPSGQAFAVAREAKA